MLRSCVQDIGHFVYLYVSIFAAAGRHGRRRVLEYRYIFYIYEMHQKNYLTTTRRNTRNNRISEKTVCPSSPQSEVPLKERYFILDVKRYRIPAQNISWHLIVIQSSKFVQTQVINIMFQVCDFKWKISSFLKILFQSLFCIKILILIQNVLCSIV